jgi:hypothetical protein
LLQWTHPNLLRRRTSVFTAVGIFLERPCLFLLQPLLISTIGPRFWAGEPLASLIVGFAKLEASRFSVSRSRGAASRTMVHDSWLDEFKKGAAPRLKLIFEKDLDGMPPKLIQQLERLRQVENELLKREPKKT